MIYDKINFTKVKRTKNRGTKEHVFFFFLVGVWTGTKYQDKFVVE